MTDLNVKGWNILIVDDEADNLTVLEVLFSFYDAVVTTSRSGEKALDLLCNNVYRLALLDLQMPKVSGWDLVKRVREHTNPAIRNTPLIAVTALAMPGDKERVLASGFDGYISKPIDAVTFVEGVQTILALPNHQHAAPAPESQAQSQPAPTPAQDADAPKAETPIAVVTTPKIEAAQPETATVEAATAATAATTAVEAATVEAVITTVKPPAPIPAAEPANIEAVDDAAKSVPASPLPAEVKPAVTPPVTSALQQTRPLPPLPSIDNPDADTPSGIGKQS